MGIFIGVIRAFIFISRNNYLPYNLKQVLLYIYQYSINEYVLIITFGSVIVSLLIGVFPKLKEYLLPLLITTLLFVTGGYFLNTRFFPGFFEIKSIIGNFAFSVFCLLMLFLLKKKLKINLEFVKFLYSNVILIALIVLFVGFNVWAFFHSDGKMFINVEKKMSDKEFVRLFDLDFPGLENVKSSVETGDFETAAFKLIKYFNERGEETWLMKSEQFSYFDSTYIIEKAEDAVKHVFTNRGIEIKLEDDINWTNSPVSNKEWVYRLNTHYWWWRLAVAYKFTKNERYSIEFNNQLLDWIHDNPVMRWKDESRPDWRLLEAGCRMIDSWILAFQLFSDSQFFTTQNKKMMLAAIYNHGQFLSLFKSPVRNHLLFESLGLGYISVFFPEFKNSEKWEKTAFERIEYMIDTEINDDGSYVELSTWYHKTTSGLFDQITFLARKAENKEFFDSGYMKKLENLFEFLVKVSKPDGTIPAINDGHTKDVMEMLTYAGEKYDRPDFTFVGSNYSEGVEPVYTSCALPDAGIYVMRSGWDINANYMIVDAGPYGSGHGHEDKLSFELYAFGKTFLVDPGTFTYNEKNPYRYYFMRSSAHNTITVDGKSQLRYWDKKNWNYHDLNKNNNQWQSTSEYDFFSGNYEDGYGVYKEKIDDSIIHTRKILFVKPDYWFISDMLDGKGKHKYRQHFQFVPVQLEQTEGKSVYTKTANSQNMAILPLNSPELKLEVVEGQENPIQGWVAEDFQKKLAAPMAIYSKDAEAPTPFYNILFPSNAEIDITKMSVESVPVTMDGKQLNETDAICVKFISENWEDVILVSHRGKGTKKFAGFSTDVDIAFFRKDKSGKIIKKFEIDDTNKIQGSNNN